MAITFLQGYSNEAGDSAVGWVKAKQKENRIEDELSIYTHSDLL